MITRVFRGKLIVIGDQAVGKTALSQLYVKDGREFTKNYSMTFSAEINSKLIPIPGTNDAVEFIIIDSPGVDLYSDVLPKFTFSAEINSKLIPIPGTNDAVEFIIIDSPGVDLYSDVLPKFWNRPDLLLIVFDVTRIKTLDSVSDWISVIQKAKWRGDRGNPIAAVLFGNKTDLEKRKACTEEEAIQVADRFEMKYFSGSVKNNQGLEDPMQFLAESFYKFCLKNKLE